MGNRHDVHSLISSTEGEQTLVWNSDNFEHNFSDWEMEILNDICSLHLRALQQPSHLLFEELVLALTPIFLDSAVRADLNVKEDMTPTTVDILFSEIISIVDCISPIRYGQHNNVDFVDYFNRMEASVRGMVCEIEDSISLKRTGLNRESRLSEIIRSLFSMYDNVVKAGVILGNTHHELWSPLLDKRSLQDILPQSEEDKACPVCLDVNISEEENFVMFSSCKHLFCHSCIVRWMENNSSCPMCRQPVAHWTCRDEFLAFKEDQRALQEGDGASTSYL